MAESFKLQLARAEIERALESQEPLFVPGVKLTFIMRDPENDEADLIVTADTLDGIGAAVERQQAREAARG